MSRCIGLLTVTVLLTACSGLTSPEDRASVRVLNESSVDFDEVSLGFKGEAWEFMAVPAGSSSSYHGFGEAYHYGSISVRIGEERYWFGVLDYVGETPLPGGHYTYRIDIDVGEQQLCYSFEVDEAPREFLSAGTRMCPDTQVEGR